MVFGLSLSLPWGLTLFNSLRFILSEWFGLLVCAGIAATNALTLLWASGMGRSEPIFHGAAASALGLFLSVPLLAHFPTPVDPNEPFEAFGILLWMVAVPYGLLGLLSAVIGVMLYRLRSNSHPSPLPHRRSKVQHQKGFASWHVLAVLAVMAGVLLFIQRQRASSEVSLATGPSSSAQRAFFESAAGRPDLEIFFRGLSPAQRIAMARRLGEAATPAATQVAATLLATFDDAAREALAESLSAIAKKDPDLVAAELGRNGSFELQGLFAALRDAFPKSVPAIAAAVGDPGRRSNAVRLLVESAQSAIDGPAWKSEAERVVLPMLDAKEAPVRAGAAEVLGKLRSKAAVAHLLSRLEAAEGEDKASILSALAEIGDPRAESVLLASLESDRPSPRILAGLGRIASPRSLARLLEFVRTGDEAMRNSALSGLSLAGDAGLAAAPDPKSRLAVAKQLKTPAADAAIREALQSGTEMRAALEAARGRETVAASVLPVGIPKDDAYAAARCEVLATTIAGRQRLKALIDDLELGGFAQRALELRGP